MRACGGIGEGAAIEWLWAISSSFSRYNFQPIIPFLKLILTEEQRNNLIKKDGIAREKKIELRPLEVQRSWFMDFP